MTHGDLIILHWPAHGFVNTTIIWYDSPEEPEVQFRQFPTREMAEAFAEANNLRVLDEERKQE